MRWILLIFVSLLSSHVIHSLLSPLTGWAQVFGLISIGGGYASILAFVYLMIRLRAGKKTHAYTGSIQRAAYLGMGYLSFLLVFVLLRDVFSFFMEEVSTDSRISMAIMGVSLVSMVFGYRGARYGVTVKKVDVAMPGLPRELDGFKIVQLSDMHVSAGIRSDFVEEVVALANDCAPDVVVLTGDIGDGNAQVYGVEAEPLSRLRAHHAKYYVTGNHEYYWGATAWITTFEKLGLKTLHNEHQVLHHKGAKILFAGVPDGMALTIGEEGPDPAKALGVAKESALPKILLSHQTRLVKVAEAEGFDLLISGHTHGGQFYPWTWVVSLTDRFAHGLRKYKDMWVYVSRGTGFWGPPIRLGSPPEVTLLVLRAT